MECIKTIRDKLEVNNFACRKILYIVKLSPLWQYPPPKKQQNAQNNKKQESNNLTHIGQ